MEKTRIAFIGAGCISDIYLQNITQVFRGLEITGICDLIPERAEKAKAKYGLPLVYREMGEAFSDPAVEIILNLTRPYQHYEVTRQALLAGKHVYTEKPLGITMEEGDALAALANEKGLVIGGAPDTFLGAGLQTCRKIIDSGLIGEPVGAAAFMLSHGPETWHPDPDFYYQPGGGPALDMGPYYMTALTSLLGPVKRLVALGQRAFGQRLITSQPHAGTPIAVNVDTYSCGILQFASGAAGTMFTTFDVHYPTQARLEIYGGEGTLICPDPNFFGGSVQLYRPETGVMREVPLLFDYPENSRGLGLADMAAALRQGRAPRAGLAQIHHVLDVLTGFSRSAVSGAWLEMKTGYQRPAPMRKAALLGVLEE